VKGLWTRFTAWFRRQGGRRVHILCAALVLVVSLGLRFRAIGESLPYCNHIDEDTWSRISFRMLQTGDLNPHRFRKPSFPVYLMAGGFSVGLARAMITGEASGASDLGDVAMPYYRLPTVSFEPKALFATFSVVALGLAGVVGSLTFQKPILLWLVPLLASVSPTYYRLSWAYMNVDVVGAFFALATVAYLVVEHARDTAQARPVNTVPRALVAGVLAGLTIGSKYNLFPILLPCVLWFFFFDRAHALLASGLVAAAAAVAFLLTTPYAVLDYRAFLADVGKEVNHYATGHFGRTYPPGFAMLWRHGIHFVEEFGRLPFVLSLCGAGLFFRRDWRWALIIFSYPLAFVAFMSMQRVFFERNLMGVQLFVALALAIAIVELPSAVSTAAVRWAPRFRAAAVRRWVIVGTLALLVVGSPWRNAAAAYASLAEPRAEAMRWIKQHIPRGTLVLVDRKLRADVSAISSDYVVIGSRMPDEEVLLLSLDRKKRVVVVTFRKGVSKYLAALPGAKVKLRLMYWPEVDAANISAVAIIVR
jgi:hypothetical protein